jgi:hypothetical protein
VLPVGRLPSTPTNLTPRQSHINLQVRHPPPTVGDHDFASDELPIASSNPPSPGSDTSDILSGSLSFVATGTHTGVEDSDSELDDHDSDSSIDEEDSDNDLDENGFLKVPNGCTGAAVHWAAGSVWDSYAYQQHADDNLGFKPVAFEDGNWIRFRADNCLIFLQSPQEENSRVCANCQALLHSKNLRKFMERAKQESLPAHTPWKYLTSRQLRELLVSARKQIDRLRLQVSINFLGVL